MLEGKLDRTKKTFAYNGTEYNLEPFIYTEEVQQLDEIRNLVSLCADRGKIPILCTSLGRWLGIEDNEKVPLKPGIANDTTLCIVQWTTAIKPRIPDEWETWLFWEYKADGTCWFNGDINDLSAISGYESPDETKSIIMTCPHCGKRIKL